MYSKNSVQFPSKASSTSFLFSFIGRHVKRSFYITLAFMVWHKISSQNIYKVFKHEFQLLHSFCLPKHSFYHFILNFPIYLWLSIIHFSQSLFHYLLLISLSLSPSLSHSLSFELSLTHCLSSSLLPTPTLSFWPRLSIFIIFFLFYTNFFLHLLNEVSGQYKNLGQMSWLSHRSQPFYHFLLKILQ